MSFIEEYEKNILLEQDSIFLEEPVKKYKNSELKNLQPNIGKFGKTIIPFGAHPEEHEKEIAKILNKYGKDVEFLIPMEIKNARTPDIKMDGRFWEIKSPTGNSRRTIETNLRKASKQAKNIIVDLRKIKIDETKAVAQIIKEFKFRKIINEILLIRKNLEIQILDIKR